MPARRLAATLALALVTALAACAPKEKAPAAPPQRYEVKGEIVGLPSVGSREIMMKHEAIPGFRDDAGKVVGMESMTMPFTLAEGVSTDGFAAGDAVDFTLEVDWTSKRDPVRIVRLSKSTLIQKMDLESGTIPTPGNSTQQ